MAVNGPGSSGQLARACLEGGIWEVIDPTEPHAQRMWLSRCETVLCRNVFNSDIRGQLCHQAASAYMYFGMHRALR